MGTLRDYQNKLSDDGCEILQRKKIVYYCFEVRTGKTLTALETAKKYGAKKVLFLTKSTQLNWLFLIVFIFISSYRSHDYLYENTYITGM